MRTISAIIPLLVIQVGCSSCGSTSPSSEPSAGQPEPSQPVQPAELTPVPEPSQLVQPAELTPVTNAEPLARVRPPTPEQAARLAEASNAFAFDLYGEVRGEAGNLVFSPASISLAFAMTYAGARGETAEQMKRVLHYGNDAGELHESAGRLLAAWNDPERESYELHVVNRLFGQRGFAFLDDFVALTRDTYRAPFEVVDFAADAEAQRLHINGWVEGQTNDRIQDLIPVGGLDELTRLVLINAVYFLGKWVHAFEESATRERTFYIGGRTGRALPMMRQTHEFRYGELDGVQILEMPYEGDDLVMTLILPGERNGLSALEAQLDAARVERWLAVTRSAQRVEVILPRFELEDARIPLQSALVSMGMELPFDAARADFTAMAAPSNREDKLYIASCFHEAFVKVDEEGTEAAAATAVAMRSRGRASAPSPEPPTFRADHPFLFMIRDTRSSAIVFLGRVVDPS